MISNINSMLNSSQNRSSSNHTVLTNTGPLAKLSSEIKLIESLSPIKLISSEAINIQGKPAQLLQATTSQQQAFSLINTGTPIPTLGDKSAQLSTSNHTQASLTFPTGTQNTATQNPIQNQVQNLTMASRVINLTVTSIPANPNATPNTQLAMVTDGQDEFPILSQTMLKKGDVVRVLVDANNNVQVLPNKTNTSLPLAMEALKQSLPKQLSSNDMSLLIKQLQSLNASTSANLPPRIQQALSQLIQNIPNLTSLMDSPAAMKQAIQSSGLFSESLLKNNNPQLPADLKLNLTRLNNTQESNIARPVSFPTEQIANAIERITTNQLRHFSDPNQMGAQTYPLNIELPIKDGLTSNLIGIQIDQEAKDNEKPDHERRWLVKLKFDFEETGPFEARTSIQGDKVGVIFAAENPETVQKLRQNMAQLKKQLAEKDIEVERLDVFQAKLQEDKPTTNHNQSLIDVRT
ncbi:flagellar hook-length control protein FliK [Marinomonas transparens]|uniref:Flagellar hook-length control protein FliK n=1 Tax=Marinomonas transparens TaxID=2795388 RepID=A0A934JIP7_9GAMM|nr:flagellar hook-length control protein FliK [Marinomonas transparens]MBJ7536775.1 flagellar hook-length control protein FliK [Marinomonas transparens]